MRRSVSPFRRTTGLGGWLPVTQLRNNFPAGGHHWIAGGVMRMLRRALVALGLAGMIAAVLRARGSGGVPPQTGGWRELAGSDFE